MQRDEKRPLIDNDSDQCGYTTSNTSNGQAKRKGQKGRTDDTADSNQELQERRISFWALFRFSSATDRLLMLIGSLFAILEGAGAPAMALVFGTMTNTLVDTVKFGLANTANTTIPVEPTAPQPTDPQAPVALAPIEPQAPTPLTPSEFEALMSGYALLYVYIGVLVYLSSIVQITCWQTSCERQTHRIRKFFFRSVLRQELGWFDRHQSGELSANFNDDIERIRDGTGEQFSSIIKYTSSFLSGFIVGFVVSWRLALVILAVTPVLALFSAYMGRMLATSTRREQEKYAKAGALAEEVLVAIRTVFALGGQRYEIKRYTRKLNESKQIAIWKYAKLSLVLGGSMFALYATYGLALWVATELLSVNMITAGSAMTVIMAVMMGASALGNIIPPLQTISMSLSSAALIYQLIDSIPTIDASNCRGLKLSKVTANIKFENVTFSYPTRKTDQPVLRALNFELKQGQTVAVCGRTGSGKSTLINLLLRFYDPDHGCIYLDNCNLKDLNVAWLRSLAGIVEQEPALFDCSIQENIALGATHESDKTFERVVEAAKLANAHKFIIGLSEGYSTRCGDRGVQMSGGQKQRIAMARALLSNPKLLLLDEATSALDSESEFMVQSALNRARQGRTTIIIAHRLSTIRHADLICVMDGGAIVEMGKHDELMASKGAYFQLVSNQTFKDSELGGAQATELDSDSDSNSVSNERAMGVPAFMRLKKMSSSQLLDETHDSSCTLAGTSLTTSMSAKRYSIDQYEPISWPSKSLMKPPKLQSKQQMQPERQKQTHTEAELAMPTLRDFFTLVRPEMGMILLGVLSAILAGALLPAFALFYAQIFDTFTQTGDQLLESGSFWALMFVALAAANFVVMAMRVSTMTFAVETTMARVRSQCFTQILRQHVGWFDEATNSPQRLTTRLAADIPQIKAVLNTRITTMISGVATVLAALFIAFYLGWKLAILLTAALPILLYVGFIQMRLSRGDRAQHVKRMENASRLATEAIEHIKLIQAINQEEFFFEKFSEQLKKPMEESLRSARKFGFVYGLSQSTIYFVYGAAFRWGAHLMATGEMEPLTVFRIFFAIAFTAVAVGQWGGLSGDMSRANYAIALILKLLNTRPVIDNLAQGGIKPSLRGHVQLQDLYFRYPTRQETPVLQGLSLSVQPGQTLALVGPSGQGKSTLAALMLRFYNPDRGVVRIDNYDIRCINLNYLRLHVGLVSQEPCLFKASIKDNILYGLNRSRYSMRDVINAAKVANIHDFIESLPEGYNTQVGERGTQMSGGQKQRIAIARTVIRDPTIMILDEATSALDAESEQLVNQALERASKGKTCIKIAHRLSTVRNADQIAVIEKGTVVELGTHEELMAYGKRGHYYRLMQKQEISVT